MKKNIANCFTLLNLVFGFFAIVYILQGFSNSRAEAIFPQGGIYWASLFILFAAIVDFLDGLLARMFNASSQMGKELDSLADLVSFGVAPGLIVFQFLKISFGQNFIDNPINNWYFVPAVLLPVAGAFRLARYNLSTAKTGHFQGLPIPAAGLLIASFPVIFVSDTHAYFKELLASKIFLYALILVVGFLMISTTPMMSLKFSNSSLKDNWVKYVLILLGIIFAFVFHWLAVPYLFVVYLLLSIIFLRKEY
ncbi:MAG: CDP-alcohol phosphatidyltransferase family protein [Arachidicoccus sp.]|nr:CDP-alcohol phosphatidyltransferase family protein [Arachidicoccus sp.]